MHNCIVGITSVELYGLVRLLHKGTQFIRIPLVKCKGTNNSYR